MITCLGLSPALDITYLLGRVETGEIHRPREVLALPGGKALNAARAVAALGSRARVIAPFAGFTGERILAALRGSGIDVVSVPTSGETRHCVTAYADDGSATEFYESALELDDAAWSGLLSAVDGVDEGWLALSGSVPDSRAASLAAVLAAAVERGIPVAVDTHGEALRQILAATSPAVVKVNRAEAEGLVFGADAAALARELAALGAGDAIAIVTDGAAGAVAVQDGRLWRAEPPERGRYAVGSGDCFLAGLLVELDRGRRSDLGIADALALATAAAAANAMVPGAAVFRRDDVDRLVVVEHVHAD